MRELLTTLWDQYWPIIYDILSQPPPILWILLGVFLIIMLIPIRRKQMDREEEVRRMVSDEALQMLENLADTGRITWKEAEREMIRMGRNFGWGDLIPKRTKEYQLNSSDIAQLKGMIKARLEGRKSNGQDKPVSIPGEPPTPHKKRLSGGRIGQLIKRHTL